MSLELLEKMSDDEIINPGESIDLYLNIDSDYEGDFGYTTFTLSSMSDKITFTNE